MAALFDGIPLDRVSTSMTINATAIILLALYIAVAQPAGRAARRSCPARSRTTSSRNTWRAAPTSTRRAPRCASSPTSSRSASASCRTGTRSRSAAITSAKRDRRRCRRWRSRSRTRSPTCRRRSTPGLDVNQFGQRLSFFFNAHNDFLEEIAKFRAARRLWARIMRDRFGATNPRAQQLRFHTQTAGSTLTAQQPDNNIVRVALQALAAVLGGTQSLHCNGRDEALGAADRGIGARSRCARSRSSPSRPASRTPSIRSAGSYAIEALTDEIERGRRGAPRADRRVGRHAGRDRDRASSSARSRSRPIAAQLAIDSGAVDRRRRQPASRDRGRQGRADRLLSTSIPRSSAGRSSASRPLRADRDPARVAGGARRRRRRRRARRRQPRAADHRAGRGAGHRRRNLRRDARACSANSRRQLAV